MTTLSIMQAYTLLRQAGFTETGAIDMTAIGLAESSLNDHAIGDVGLEDRTWGPSVGMFQERTLKAEYGRNTIRDEHWLLESAFNQCKAAYQTSNGGRTFQPWSTWLHGTAQAHIATVRSVVSSQGGSTVGSNIPTIPTGGSDMLTSASGASKEKYVLTGGVWRTLMLGNPCSLIGGPALIAGGDVTLYFTDLAPDSTVQVRPYLVKPKGKAWVYAGSAGLDEHRGTSGSTFVKSSLAGIVVPTGQLLRVQVTVTGQAEANLTVANWRLAYQK